MMSDLTPTKIKKECVKVAVRCRPLNTKEFKNSTEKIIKVHTEKGAIEICNPKSPVHTKQFTFDTVYDENSQQTDLYDETVRPIVDSVLMGFNGTIFAYGQTGAGKTYTMEGDSKHEDKKGIIPLAFEHIFHVINHTSTLKECLVTASYIEIYKEEVRDLLSENRRVCELRQNLDGKGVFVKDLTVHVCKSKEELENVLKAGKKNRSVGTTNMNVHSSRSHAIFMLSIEQSFETSGPDEIRIGKLNLVDLAGSERANKTGVAGERMKESIKINLSLSALGNVISALVDGSNSHIPYRDSKLTRLLENSLGGNSRTVMIANIGPAQSNCDETLTTLRYANRAKNIRNTPIVNENPKDTLLKKYKEEIERLKKQLELAAYEKKKKKRKAKEKTLEDSEADDDDNESYKKMEEKLNAEKASILNNETMIDEVKKKALEEIRLREEQLARTIEGKEELLKKIQALESKLICGGQNIIDHVNDKEKELEERRKALQETKTREREIMRKLEEEEESALEIKETFSTLQQEVDAKTKKLKKLFLKLQAIKRDIDEEEEIASRERQEKEAIEDNIIKELKYTHLVIENFIPPEVKAKILSEVAYNEDENTWYFVSGEKNFPPMPRPCNSQNKNKRPMSEYAKKMWKTTSNPRYASENIAVIDLDYTPTSVRDYIPKDPVIDPIIKAFFESLENESDVEIDASEPRYNQRKKTAKRRARSKTERPRQRDDKDEPHYPMPRGLVPRN